MRSRKLILVTSLMAFSIIGLLSLQTYWAIKIIKENEIKFESSVNHSLANVVRLLEKKDIESRTYDFFVSVDTNSNYKSKTKTQMAWVSDSDTNSNTFVSVSSSSNVVVIPENENDVVVDVQVEDGKHVFSYSEGGTIVNDTIISPEGSQTIILKKHIERVQEKEELISEVWEELVVKKVSIQERLNPSSLDSIIRTELLDNGIETNFFYGVFLDQDSLVFSTLEDKNLNLTDFQFQSRLFPSDVQFSGSYLGLFFPDKGNYILFESLLPLLSSVLFILIAGFCFWYVAGLFMGQKKLNEIKNDFIDNMTHELKTPIANISLASESLQTEKIGGQAKSRERYLGIIQSESSLLLKQIEEVLEVKDDDWKGENLEIENVNLHELVNNSINSFSLSINEKKAIVKNEIPVNLKINWDKKILQKVFNNLIDNSLKFGKDGVEASISIEEKGDRYTITVSDTGPGISKEFKSMVFDKFFRVPSGNIQNARGSGLGLNFVQSAIQDMDGNIQVEDNLPKGSKFIISLPKKHF